MGMACIVKTDNHLLYVYALAQKKTVHMQNLKSNTAMVVELHFFMKMMKNQVFLVFHTLSDIFIQFTFFYMFSTLMSLEDRLRLKPYVWL